MRRAYSAHTAGVRCVHAPVHMPRRVDTCIPVPLLYSVRLGEKRGPQMSQEVSIDVVSDFLEPSAHLLTFYKSKLVNFETERAEYLRRLADVEVRCDCLHARTGVRACACV